MNLTYFCVFRTPLHCAASCNNLAMVKFLVEHGACIFATTLSDRETAAEKCEEDEEGFDGCSEYLYSKFLFAFPNNYKIILDFLAQGNFFIEQETNSIICVMNFDFKVALKFFLLVRKK